MLWNLVPRVVTRLLSSGFFALHPAKNCCFLKPTTVVTDGKSPSGVSYRRFPSVETSLREPRISLRLPL